MDQATISTAQIIRTSDGATTASLEFNTPNGMLVFGGEKLFKCLPEDTSFCDHFVQRCIEVGQVDKFEDLAGRRLDYEVEQLQVVGIKNPEGDDWFYPVTEFENMEDGE